MYGTQYGHGNLPISLLLREFIASELITQEERDREGKEEGTGAPRGPRQGRGQRSQEEGVTAAGVPPLLSGAQFLPQLQYLAAVDGLFCSSVVRPVIGWIHYGFSW